MHSHRLTLHSRKLKDQDDIEGLKNISPGDRIGMVWPITMDAWAFNKQGNAESRLQRHIIHIYRRKG